MTHAPTFSSHFGSVLLVCFDKLSTLTSPLVASRTRGVGLVDNHVDLTFFCNVVGRRWPKEEQPLDVRVVGWGMLAVVLLQVACMLSDPGYVVRSPEQPVCRGCSEDEQTKSPSIGQDAALLAGLKYCVQCRVWQVR